MQTIAIEIVGRMLDARGIKPDADFTAVAGSEYGHVVAWQMPDGQWLIRYGDALRTSYALSESGDELWGWLVTDDLSGAERILRIANVLGGDYVEFAEEDDHGPFAVIATHWRSGHTKRSHFVQDEHGKPMQFPTLTHAQDWCWCWRDGVGYTIVQIEEERRP